MVCRNCNTEISDEAKICPECGADTKTGEIVKPEFFDSEDGYIEPKAEGKAPEETVKTPVKEINTIRQSQLDEIEERRNKKKQRQKRNKIISIGVLCVLVAGAVGSGIYLIRTGFSNDDAIVITTPRPTEDVSEIVPDDAEPTVDTEYETPAPTVQTMVENSGAVDEEAMVTGSTVVTAKPASSSSAGTSSGRTGTSSASSSTGGASTSSSGKTTASSSGSSNTSSSKPTGVVSSSQTRAKMIYGDEVFYDDKTGNWLFRFTSDGVEYIAKVAAGSSTKDVENKYFAASIKPTSEVYDGNTVYEIVHMTDCQNDDFVIADSSTKLLTKAEIESIPKDQLKYARNEIFARHGRKFTKQIYVDYFSEKSWYSINPAYNYDNEAENLTDIERQNVLMLKAAEEKG